MLSKVYFMPGAPRPVAKPQGGPGSRGKEQEEGSSGSEAHPGTTTLLPGDGHTGERGVVGAAVGTAGSIAKVATGPLRSLWKKLKGSGHEGPVVTSASTGA